MTKLDRVRKSVLEVKLGVLEALAGFAHIIAIVPRVALAVTNLIVELDTPNEWLEFLLEMFREWCSNAKDDLDDF